MASGGSGSASRQRCPGCGQELSALARVCLKCGATLSAAGLHRCRNCGAVSPQGARFCPSCSTPVSGQPAQPSRSQPPSQPAQQPQAFQQQFAPASGSSCGKVALLLAIWFVFWVVVAAALYIFVVREQPQTLLGVGLAALISLVFLVKSLSDQWQGQIVDIRTERVTVSESDSDSGTDQRTEDQEFAYIREPSGKTRKMRSMMGWQVGDRLEKRRGETDIRIFSR